MVKWSSGKKKSNIDEHGEIYNKFFITSCILLGICLSNCDLPSQHCVFLVSTFNSQKDVERSQTCLQHIHIWRCPTHILKTKRDMLEARSKVYQFVGYSKGMRGHYFYSQVDLKKFVNKNSRFLEEDYIMSNMVKRHIDWKALEDTSTLTQGIMGLEIPTHTIPISSSTPMPHHGRKVVMQPNRFMYLRRVF